MYDKLGAKGCGIITRLEDMCNMAAKSASWDEISAMIKRGEFIGNNYETINGFLKTANCSGTVDKGF